MHINMLLAIDSLAERYKMLPHQILQQASTFDLYVLNAATEWKNRQNEIASSGTKMAVPHMSQEQLKAMMASVKE